jgi:riboflavin synthase
MFTGLIEALGVVSAAEDQPEGGRRLVVKSDLDVGIGDSVANSGVCLTVVEVTADRFAVDVGPETLARTTMGRLAPGDAVNLERALLPTTRMGGHLVQGHVDAVGEVRSIAARDNAFDIWIDAPPDVLRLVIPRGSVAVDGISLTVTGRDDAGFSVCIIPHTWNVTTLGQAKVGQGVNLEADLMARYIADLLGEIRG